MVRSYVFRSCRRGGGVFTLLPSDQRVDFKSYSEVGLRHSDTSSGVLLMAQPSNHRHGVETGLRLHPLKAMLWR